MLKAVLFDLDGTLYDRDVVVRSVAGAQFDAFREHLPGIEKGVFVERVFVLDDHGYKDRAALYAEVIAELGMEKALARVLEFDFRTRYLATCCATPDTIDTLRCLTEHGLRLGVVTNGATRIQTEKLAALGLSDFFDAILISEVEGVRKPDAAIFMRALERCRVGAHETVFVGDNPDADVFGAMAVGMKAIWKRVPYWEMSDPGVPTIDVLSEILPICLGSDSPEERAKRIFGERASFYSTSAAHTDPSVLNRVVEMASPRSDWIALDIGTGTGHTAFALAPFTSAVVGTDLTTGMLAEAKRLQALQAVPNVVWCASDVHHLPFPDQVFDLVCCRRAAHHFSDIEAACREMHRVLRVDGRLVIDDRSVPEDDFVDRCMNTLDRFHDHSHVRQYRPSEWARMLESRGFQLERIEPYTQHRPLTSLTEGIPSEDVEQIHRILERLDGPRREALNLTEVDGEPYINHWFVMLAARRVRG